MPSTPEPSFANGNNALPQDARPNGPPPPPPAPGVVPLAGSRTSGAVGAGTPVAPALPGAVPRVASSITARANWSRYLDTLFHLANVQHAHSHRFRDTFAVSLLLAGVSLESVSKLLGHSSIRVTERHYAPWVKARQTQLEADVRRTWDESETNVIIADEVTTAPRA